MSGEARTYSCDSDQGHRHFQRDVAHAVLVCDWDFLDSIAEEEYLRHGYCLEWQETVKLKWYRLWKDRRI